MTDLSSCSIIDDFVIGVSGGSPRGEDEGRATVVAGCWDSRTFTYERRRLRMWNVAASRGDGDCRQGEGGLTRRGVSVARSR